MLGELTDTRKYTLTPERQEQSLAESGTKIDDTANANEFAIQLAKFGCR